jgi:hypothetical protein
MASPEVATAICALLSNLPEPLLGIWMGVADLCTVLKCGGMWGITATSVDVALLKFRRRLILRNDRYTVMHYYSCGELKHQFGKEWSSKVQQL